MRREVCRAALRVAASSWSAQGSSCVGGIKFEHRMVENVSLLHFCGISMRERGIVVPSYAYNGRACFAARGTTSEKPRQSGEALSTDIKDKNRTQGTGSPSSSSPSSSKRAPEYGQDSPPPPPPSMLAVLSSMIAGAGGAIVVAAIGYECYSAVSRVK